MITVQDKHQGFHAAITSVLQMGFGHTLHASYHKNKAETRLWIITKNSSLYTCTISYYTCV